MTKHSLTILFLIISFSTNNLSYAETEDTKKMEVKSSAFKNNGIIPKQYTCDGENFSPPLAWSGISANTKSLALICDDPDAPNGTWVHWIIFNMPPAAKGLQEGVLPVPEFAHTARQGINDFKKLGYSGPCPPSGTHRYFFKLYALNAKLNLEAGATKKQLEDAMKGHIVDQTELAGKYKR